MSSKKTTTQHQQNSLPDWLTTPYQQATQAATNLYQSQPSLGAGTQGDINQISANADAGHRRCPVLPSPRSIGVQEDCRALPLAR